MPALGLALGLPFQNAILGGGGPPPFSPISLSPIVWLDASQLPVVSDGTALATFTDESGNSNSPTQATSADRPLYKTAGANGKPYVLFDGVDQYMVKAFTLTQPTTIYIVAKYVSLASGATLIDGANLNSARIFDANGEGELTLYAGTSGPTVTVDTNWHAFKAVFNGTTSNWILDGGPNAPPRVGDAEKISTGDAGTAAAGGLTLGVYAGLSAYGNVAIAELVEISALTSGANDTAMFGYFHTKYGTVIPSVSGPNKTDLRTNNGNSGYYSVDNPFYPSDAGKVLRQTAGTGWNWPCGMLIGEVDGPSASFNSSQYQATLTDPNFFATQGTQETNLGTGFVFTPTAYIRITGNSLTNGATGLSGATGFGKYQASYMDQSFENGPGGASLNKTVFFMDSFGFGGGQTSLIMAEAVVDAAPTFPGATINIISFSEWVNQMSFGDPGTTTPAEQYAFAQSFATTMRGKGFLVMYLSPSAYNGEDYATVTQAMRNQLATGFSNGDFDGFVDLQQIPETQNIAYFADGIHWPNAVHALVGVAHQTETLRLVGFTNPVANTAAPTLTSTGSLSTPLPGDTLTCSTGSWTNSPTLFVYTWWALGSVILAVGTNLSSYVVQGGDGIYCTVSATNTSGGASKGSAATGVVQSAPFNTIAPVITSSGTLSAPVPTDVLSSTLGTWLGTNTFTYQWFQLSSEFVPISGATDSTYTVQVTDIGFQLSCQVQAVNSFGILGVSSNLSGAVLT